MRVFYYTYKIIGLENEKKYTLTSSSLDKACNGLACSL